MRDTARIECVLGKLREAWLRSPHLRLGELLSCLATSDPNEGAEDIISTLERREDSEWERVLDAWIGARSWR